MPAKEHAQRNGRQAFRYQTAETQHIKQERSTALAGQKARTAPRLLAPDDVLQLQRAVGNRQVSRLLHQKSHHQPIQRVVYQNEAALWQAVAPDTTLEEIRTIINGNTELRNAFEDSLLNLNRMNFVSQVGREPEAGVGTNPDQTYNIYYGLRSTQQGYFKDQEKYIGAIIHEMGHVNSGLQYTTNIPPGAIYHVVNMHLPAANGPLIGGTQVGENQRDDPVSGWQAQGVNMQTNWEELEDLRTTDHGFTNEEINYLGIRENYAMAMAPETHYDTVLVDILYYLQSHGLTEKHYYLQATAMLLEANNRRRAGNGTVPVVPLVQAPDNKFLQLYNDVSALLHDPLWAQEGEALIGKKTPSGVRQMRAALDANNKRSSLNRIQEIAIAKAGQNDKRRSSSTSKLYDALSKVNRRSKFGEVIASVRLCRLWLGQNKEEALELI